MSRRVVAYYGLNVLEVYKATDKKIALGSMEPGGEFWLIYFGRTGDVPAGTMTVYLHFHEEMMQAGSGPIHRSQMPQLLRNSATEGISNIEPAPATQPAK